MMILKQFQLKNVSMSGEGQRGTHTDGQIKGKKKTPQKAYFERLSGSFESLSFWTRGALCSLTPSLI